ncbi:MAG: response regulator, partial [Methanomicrobiales archaeon]|nr:response regulator [Methanomicrobiales archaeon]
MTFPFTMNESPGVGTTGEVPDTPVPMPRVQVVEDEFIIAADLKRRLQKAGYTVVGVVDTAEDAIALAGKERPDVILMDISLKGDHTGIHASQVIRETYN